MESTETQQAKEVSPVQQPIEVQQAETSSELQQETSADPQQETPSAPSAPTKPIHTLIIDTGPLIKNDPPISTLLAQAEEIYTLPSVIPEIKDAATRSRVETQLLPFLKLRSPKPASIKFVTDFARRTGDLEVLSRPDLHLIALAYELECERNGGDWRLRNTPGQKRTNGKSPAQIAKDEAAGVQNEEEKPASHEENAEGSTVPEASQESTVGGDTAIENSVDDINVPAEPVEASAEPTGVAAESTEVSAAPAEAAAEPTETLAQAVTGEELTPAVAQEAVTHQLDTLTLEPEKDIAPEVEQPVEEVAEDEDDDEDGWITPSNLKKHQQKDQQAAPEQPIQRVLQVALLTSDFAMQNVLLRINLNLVSPNMARITRVKTWVLRCHGCFQITRIMSKQFCPKCGQPTLTRVSSSTDQNGNFQIFLKKNFQWNNRGNVYSVPKPVHGTANTKYRNQGGGKNGWGTELILAEDQKEYTRKTESDRRLRQRDLMDEDYLPGILTGHRQNGPGKTKVGAGRNVNSKKRN